MKVVSVLTAAVIAGVATVDASLSVGRSLQSNCTACVDGSAPTNLGGTLPASNDGTEASCGGIEALAATFVADSFECRIAQAYFADPCGCPKPAFPSGDGVCTVCADGSTPATPDTIFTTVNGAKTDCLSFAFFLSSNFTSSDSLCGILQADVASVCGCPIPTYSGTPVCELCDGSIPDASKLPYQRGYEVDGDHTCGSFQFRAAAGIEFDDPSNNNTRQCNAMQYVFGELCECSNAVALLCNITCPPGFGLNLPSPPKAGFSFDNTSNCADIYIDHFESPDATCTDFESSFALACCTDSSTSAPTMTPTVTPTMAPSLTVDVGEGTTTTTSTSAATPFHRFAPFTSVAVTAVAAILFFLL